jgi:TRAP transporter TAXI family solute receptor
MKRELTRRDFLKVSGGVFASAYALGLAGCGGPGGGGQAGGKTEVDPKSSSPVNMTMAGASAQGYFRTVGETINDIVREEYPGSAIAYEPGSPIGSLAKVANGQAGLAVAISAVEMLLAKRGEAPYEESLAGKFVGVMRIQDAQRFNSVMEKGFADQYGIETFQDIAEKKPPLRVTINQQGNTQIVAVAESIFEAYGITFDDIKEWGGEIFFVSGGDPSFELLRDRKANMYFNAQFIPISQITDIGRSLDLVWVHMDENKLEKVADTWDLRVGTVKPGEYDFLKKETPTIVEPSGMITNPDVPATDIYKIVKSIYDHQDRMQGIHPAMKNFSENLMVGIQEHVPLHPGAEQFYEEKGLIRS